MPTAPDNQSVGALDDVVVLCGEQLAEGQVVLVDEEPGRQCWLRRE